MEVRSLISFDSYVCGGDLALQVVVNSVPNLLIN